MNRAATDWLQFRLGAAGAALNDVEGVADVAINKAGGSMWVSLTDSSTKIIVSPVENRPQGELCELAIAFADDTEMFVAEVADHLVATIVRGLIPQVPHLPQ